jgi:hypothetical protein
MRWLGSWVGDWVAEWFGPVDSGPPGSMASGLFGSGTCSGNLSFTGTAPDSPSFVSGGLRVLSRRLLALLYRRQLRARLAGTGRLRATLTVTPWARTRRGVSETLLAVLLADED